MSPPETRGVAWWGKQTSLRRTRPGAGVGRGCWQHVSVAGIHRGCHICPQCVKRPNPEQSRAKPKSGGHELTHPRGTQCSHVAARNQDRPVLCVMRTPRCSQPASRYSVPQNAGSSLLSLTVFCPLVFLFKWHVFDECCISLTKKIIERKRTDCSVLISKHANKLSSLTEPTQCYTGNSCLYLIPLKLTQKSTFH